MPVDRLYHIVPNDLEGDFLYPLHALARERPLLWARTPHVFYRGSLDTRGLETIAW